MYFIYLFIHSFHFPNLDYINIILRNPITVVLLKKKWILHGLSILLYVLIHIEEKKNKLTTCYLYVNTICTVFLYLCF